MIENKEEVDPDMHGNYAVCNIVIIITFARAVNKHRDT